MFSPKNFKPRKLLKKKTKSTNKEELWNSKIFKGGQQFLGLPDPGFLKNQDTKWNNTATNLADRRRRTTTSSISCTYVFKTIIYRGNGVIIQHLVHILLLSAELNLIPIPIWLRMPTVISIVHTRELQYIATENRKPIMLLNSSPSIENLQWWKIMGYLQWKHTKDVEPLKRYNIKPLKSINYIQKISYAKVINKNVDKLKFYLKTSYFTYF